MLNINKIRHISFVKFLILFVAYMFFINYIFLFKGLFLGFLSDDTLSFSIMLTALLSIFFLLLFAGVFCILLVPFLLKPLAIFFIMISSISAYFMQAYGVIIDKGMLLNVLHTDTREAFSYFNASLAIWLIFVTILPCIHVALVKISYGSFKSALRSRVKIALSTLASAAVIFALMSKIFIPFFREPQRLKRFTPILPHLLWHKISKVFGAKTTPFYLRGR